MDNFHFVQVKPKIENKDVSIIKEAIFKRARQKAQQMNEEQNTQYTSEVKNDIMEIASADFRSSEFNPFNKFKESMGLNSVSKTEEKADVEESKSVQESSEVFGPRIKPLKHNIESVSNSNFTESVKDETMTAARNQFRHNMDLTTSLNFLNAKAAIQMAKYAHSKINYLS